jgi:hypothetical protein
MGRSLGVDEAERSALEGLKGCDFLRATSEFALETRSVSEGPSGFRELVTFGRCWVSKTYGVPRSRWGFPIITGVTRNQNQAEYRDFLIAWSRLRL